MPGLYKHPDGSLSRVAQPYDGTQTAAAVTLADRSVVPVIDFHTRTGQFGNTVLALNPLIEILALDVSAGGLWSYNGNSGVINGKRNYVSPGGPVSNPSAGWNGSQAAVSNSSASIQIANSSAASGTASKTFSVLVGKKYIFSTTFQTGGNPGTSYVLKLGTSSYSLATYTDASQTSGVVAPSVISIPFVATSKNLLVTMGNQVGSGFLSLWSVPTLTPA